MNFNIFEEKIDGLDFLVLQPTKYLSDDEFYRIKPYIEKLGGHWRDRAGGFVYLKKSLLMSESDKFKEDNQFFKTPTSIVKRMIELSDLQPNAVVLEPSAGDGAILDCLPKESSFIAIEPNSLNNQRLRDKGYNSYFLKFEEYYQQNVGRKRIFTNVIMNPPFKGDLLVNHIFMAYDLLMDNGVLVSIIKENLLYMNDNKSLEFKKWLDYNDAFVEMLPYGSFKESGTMIDTGIIKVRKKML